MFAYFGPFGLFCRKFTHFLAYFLQAYSSQYYLLSLVSKHLCREESIFELHLIAQRRKLKVLSEKWSTMTPCKGS